MEYIRVGQQRHVTLLMGLKHSFVPMMFFSERGTYFGFLLKAGLHALPTVSSVGFIF